MGTTMQISQIHIGGVHSQYRMLESLVSTFNRMEGLKIVRSRGRKRDECKIRGRERKAREVQQNTGEMNDLKMAVFR